MSWVGLFIGDCSIISFYQASRWFRPSHTIKSVVFLLDLYTGVCGKRYIKSASCSNIVVYCLIITSPLRLGISHCNATLPTSRLSFSFMQ